jgi:hypothetical protein
MMELTINNNVYQFNFGMGFLREIQKQVSIPVDGAPNIKKDVGLNFSVGKIIDGDTEALVDVLFLANKGQEPRLTKNTLDAYIDDEDTDIEQLFEDVLDFLKNANATKKVMEQLMAEVAEQKAMMEAQKTAR